MNLSIEELITELSMTYSFKMHLIVEGDDDRKFFKSSLKGIDKVNLICVWGADNVMHVIREVDRIRSITRISPTLGIVDRDYRVPLGSLLQSPNLIASDARDLECMMFGSPSFEAVLSEFGSEKKVTSLGGPSVIGAVAVGAASIVGRIRFYVNQTRCGTSFQRLELSRIVDRKTLTIEPDELIKHLNARQGASGNPLPATAHDQARDTCAKARCERGQPYFQHDLLLCRGHDLMELLAIGFRSLFGTRSAAESCRENVESLFRLNYVTHFKATQMAKSIEAWLSLNSVSPHVALIH
jgi:hypothetical protein